MGGVARLERISEKPKEDLGIPLAGICFALLAPWRRDDGEVPLRNSKVSPHPSCIEAVYRHVRERDDNPVVVIPTAGGKTPILATRTSKESRLASMLRCTCASPPIE
jgi:hypothetical protein